MKEFGGGTAIMPRGAASRKPYEGIPIDTLFVENV